MIDKVEYFSTLKNIIGNITYFDLNSTNIFWTILIIIIYVCLIMYFFIKINITSIRVHWESERCNPLYMPFAGYIANPKDMSKLDYNKLNSTICLKKLYQKIIDAALTPVRWSETIVTDALQASKSILNTIFDALQKLRDALSEILNIIFNILNNVLIAVQQLLDVILDIINRTLGIITVGYYFGIEVFETTGSLTHKLWNFACIIFISIVSIFLVGFMISFQALSGSIIGLISGIATSIVGKALMFVPFMGAVGTALQNAASVIINFASKLGKTVKKVGKMAILQTLAFTVPTTLLISWMGPMIGGVFSNNPMSWPIWYLYLHAAFYTAALNHTKLDYIAAGLCFEKNTLIETNTGTIRMKDIKPGCKLKDGSDVTAVLKLDGSKAIFYKLNDIIVSGTHTVYYKHKWIHVQDHPKAVQIGILNEPIYCLNTTNKRIKIKNTIFCDYDTVTAIELEYLKLQFPDITYNTFNQYIGKGLSKMTEIKLLNNNIVTIDKIKLGDILQNNIQVMAVVILKDKMNNIVYNLVTDKGYFYVNNKKYIDLNHELEQYLRDIPNRYI